MKKIYLVFTTIVLISVLSACEVDNYPGPNAALSGRFIDTETDELVQQDIVRGTMIELREHGYDPVTPQYLKVKPDGTYANALLFANTYTVQPVRGNFIAIEAQDFEVKGEANLDFRVMPYIRIKEPSITRNGNKIVATFKVQQNVTNSISKLGLYVHSDPNVGEPFRLIAVENNINSVADPNQVFTLELDITSNSSTLISGRHYFFRIGALINVGEAKLNYAPVVKISI
jgi:hypothetical protein